MQQETFNPRIGYGNTDNMQEEITRLLAKRYLTYGNFMENADVAQALKLIIRSGKNWHELDFDQQEALDQICSKVSRLLVGDHNHLDSWRDIVGYPMQVYSRLAAGEPPLDTYRADSDDSLGKHQQGLIKCY